VAVIRDIDVGNGKRGDVIKFYNDIFLPSIKGYLLQFQKLGEAQRQVRRPLPLHL